MLRPDEKLDFEGFRGNVSQLEEQCVALMYTLEEARREIEALKKERDHYKEFWQAMNTYHSVMSRFQLSTGSIPSAPFPSQVLYPNAAPQDMPSEYSMYSFPRASPSTFQAASSSLQNSTPTVPSHPVSPVNPKVIPQPQINPSLHQSPSQVPPFSTVNRSPETPQKKPRDKPIESYFGTSKSPERKTVSRFVVGNGATGGSLSEGGIHTTELFGFASSNQADNKGIDTQNMLKGMSPDPERESSTIEDGSGAPSLDTEPARKGLLEKDEIGKDEMNFLA